MSHLLRLNLQIPPADVFRWGGVIEAAVGFADLKAEFVRTAVGDCGGKGIAAGPHNCSCIS
jgi:hypothetical protein